MGFSPQDVDALSLWQFAACVVGYSRAQGGEDKPVAPTDDEFEDMKARLG